MAGPLFKTRRHSGLWAWVTVASLAAPLAQAHHEVGVYDRGHPIVVKGVVTSFLWANPHAWLYLRANEPNHLDWALEAGSVADLVHRGWSKRALMAGESISVLVAPRRDGHAGGQIMQVTLTDTGAVLN